MRVADLVQMPAYVLALSFVVGIVVSALKGGIEALLPPSNRWHDLLFTLLPLALSVGTMLGYVLTHGGDVFMAVVWGALSGSGAIGAYTVHTRTRNTEGEGTAPPSAPQPVPDGTVSPRRPADQWSTIKEQEQAATAP